MEYESMIEINAMRRFEERAKQAEAPTYMPAVTREECLTGHATATRQAYSAGRVHQ